MGTKMASEYPVHIICIAIIWLQKRRDNNVCPLVGYLSLFLTATAPPTTDLESRRKKKPADIFYMNISQGMPEQEWQR